MGHRAGWLTLGSGLAGGADVILIPEIPYRVEKIADAIRKRSRSGTNFQHRGRRRGRPPTSRTPRRSARCRSGSGATKDPAERALARAELAALDADHAGNTLRLAAQLEALTGLESRVSILGYVQRGGDALRRSTGCSRPGSAAPPRTWSWPAHFGVMVASRADGTEPVPIEDVAGRRKPVPPDHGWGRRGAPRRDLTRRLSEGRARESRPAATRGTIQPTSAPRRSTWAFSTSCSPTRPSRSSPPPPKALSRPRRADPRARAPHVLGTPIDGPWPDGTRTVTFRDGLLLGCREGFLDDPGRRDHRGWLRRWSTPNPTYGEVLLGPDRARRGGPHCL